VTIGDVDWLRRAPARNDSGPGCRSLSG
jgi:hypothetical protein